MIPVTGTGLLTLLDDFTADGRSKADTVLAAGYVRDNGKPAFTAFYEEVLKARGMSPRLLPPGGIDRTCRNGPAIYVACLASYNAGKLFGSWLDLSDGPDADDIREAIDAIIKESPEPFAEEYAIHDSQDLPGILARTEWPDIDKLSAYCQQWAELDYDPDKQLAYRFICDDAGEVVDQDDFDAKYEGWWNRPSDYAMDHAAERGYLKDDDTNPLFRCVDWNHYWRELEYEGARAVFDQGKAMYLIHW